MNAPPRVVYVVDDEAGMRTALARLLEVEGFEVRACASAREFLDRYDSEEVSCLILDVAMRGLNGPGLQRHLRTLGDPLPIVFLTARGDIAMSVRAMKAGAVDFLTKPVIAADLLRAVRAALKLARSRFAERTELAQLKVRYESLTPREREVMAHVVAGWLNKQIAAELGTREQTVKIHRARGMHKMQVESLADLVRLAAKLGIRIVSHQGA
jgi:FixJ family two-component response regulator